MKRTLQFLLLAGVAAACSPPAPAGPDPAADREAINQLRSDYQAAFNAADAAKLSTLISESAMEYPVNQPTRQGRAALMAATEAMFKEGKHEITITPTATEVGGDLATDIGTYRMVMTPPAGEAMTIEGRYMVIARREADGWKLTHFMDNTPAPMMMPPAAAPAATPPATP
jgi:uncharacterized protein (TIGR02246 family)